MLQKMRVLLLVGITAVLAACGGGGGSDSGTQVAGDAVDKYVGLWSGCVSDITDIGNVKLTYTISKKSANTGIFKISNQEGNPVSAIVYTDAACTIVRNNSDFKPNTSDLNFSIVGGTTVAGKAVDKIDISTANGSAKVVWFNAGNQLQIGWINLGADGYPTTLSLPVTKK